MSQLVERARLTGMSALGTSDLLALCFSRRESDVDLAWEMSKKLTTRYQRLYALGQASSAELTELTGLEEFELLRSQALIELGRRIALSSKGEVTRIDGAKDVEIALDHLRFEKKEHFVAILLDAKSFIIRIATIHIGTLSGSQVGLREVFREAIRDGAASIIVAHNHPSGVPDPSPEDIRITRDLVQAGKLLDIPLLDHVIIGERSCVSLKATGLL